MWMWIVLTTKNRIVVRNRIIAGTMALAFLLPVKMMAKASSSDNSTLLWYNAPAQQWLEALPIGNSHLGGISD